MKRKLSSLFVIGLIICCFMVGCGPNPGAQPTGTASSPMASTAPVVSSPAISSPAASSPAASSPAASSPATSSATVQPTTTQSGADLTTTASIVNNENTLVYALSKNGTWIVAVLNDIATSKELVIDGDFHDKNDKSKPLYRKLALYAQDANRKITARYTLTAPKLTVLSPNTKIMGGTFKGDVFVQANGFTVEDATVDGNVYFAKQEYKDSFVTSSGGKVTGTTDVPK